MARLTPHPFRHTQWHTCAGESAEQLICRHIALFEPLIAASQKATLKSPEGFLLAFPRGDGQAFYRVQSTRPLVLSHVPYLDAYQVEPALLRGLRLSDVYAQIHERDAQRCRRSA